MEVSQEQVIKFLREKGKRGELTLSVLGKYAPFMESINSKLGKELIVDLNTMYDELINKIAGLTATDDDRADFRAVNKLTLRWCDKISTYEKELIKLKGGE